MLFGILLALVIIILTVNFFRLLKKANALPENVFKSLKDDLISGLYLIKEFNSAGNNLFNIARRFFYSISVVLFMILAVSGFFLPLFWQTTDGVLLFIHILVTPFFAVTVTFAVVLWANKLKFNANDYAYLTRKQKSTEQKVQYWKKIYFWLFTIAVILNIGSILLAMFPVFGTNGQEILLNWHRYSALALMVFTLNYLTLRYTLIKKQK